MPVAAAAAPGRVQCRRGRRRFLRLCRGCVLKTEGDVVKSVTSRVRACELLRAIEICDIRFVSGRARCIARMNRHTRNDADNDKTATGQRFRYVIVRREIARVEPTATMVRYNRAGEQCTSYNGGCRGDNFRFREQLCYGESRRYKFVGSIGLVQETSHFVQTQRIWRSSEK